MLRPNGSVIGCDRDAVAGTVMRATLSWAHDPAKQKPVPSPHQRNAAGRDIMSCHQSRQDAPGLQPAGLNSLPANVVVQTLRTLVIPRCAVAHLRIQR